MGWAEEGAAGGQATIAPLPALCDAAAKGRAFLRWRLQPSSARDLCLPLPVGPAWTTLPRTPHPSHLRPCRSSCSGSAPPASSAAIVEVCM